MKSKSKKLLRIIKRIKRKSQLEDEIINRKNYVYNRARAKAYAEAYAETPNI